MLKYTFWKNIVAFLFEVILLVIKLWVGGSETWKPWSLKSWETRSYTA